MLRITMTSIVATVLVKTPENDKSAYYSLIGTVPQNKNVISKLSKLKKVKQIVLAKFFTFFAYFECNKIVQIKF